MKVLAALLAVAWALSSGCTRIGFDPRSGPIEDANSDLGASKDGMGTDAPLLDASAGAEDAAIPDGGLADVSPSNEATTPPDGTRLDVGALDAEAGVDVSLPDSGGLRPLRWLTIPAGTFEMGCSVGDPDCPSVGSEEPRHSVVISSFEMLETEVTQAQYLQVIGSNPSFFSSDGPGEDCGLDCPVERLDWNLAKAFCEAIGGRLPSEAEWEYAARAGGTTGFICGDLSGCLSQITLVGTHTMVEVARKAANAFGLYDMSGNVAEWVEDCWHADYIGAPATSVPWTTQCTLNERVLRGGHLSSDELEMRVSFRNPEPVDIISAGNGVRCVR